MILAAVIGNYLVLSIYCLYMLLKIEEDYIAEWITDLDEDDEQQ
jgi:hypothetical protein